MRRRSAHRLSHHADVEDGMRRAGKEGDAVLCGNGAACQSTRSTSRRQALGRQRKTESRLASKRVVVAAW